MNEERKPYYEIRVAFEIGDNATTASVNTAHGHHGTHSWGTLMESDGDPEDLARAVSAVVQCQIARFLRMYPDLALFGVRRKV